MTSVDIAFQITLIFINCILAWYFLFNKSIRIKKIITQSLVIVLFICLFVNTALFFNYHHPGVLAYAVVFSFDVLLVVLFIKWLKTYRFRPINIKDSKYVLIVLLLYTVIKTFFIINYVPIWDGYIYFNVVLDSVKTFDFTLTSYLISFRTIDHPCYAYMNFLSIGQFLDYGNIYLLNIQSHILSMTSVYCFYKIFQKLFPQTNPIELSIITLIYALAPLIFAVSFIVTTDTAIIAFYVIFLYCHFYKKKLLLLFSGAILCTSKDPGIILYVFTIAGIILNQVVENFDRKNIIQSFYRECKKQIFLILPIIIFFLVKIGTIFIYANTDRTFNLSNDSGFNCLGIDIIRIKTLIKEIFLLNFQWILLLTYGLFAVSRIYYIKRDLKKLSKYFVFIFPFLAYLFFYLVFMTYPHPRYIALFVFWNTLFFYISISKIFKRKKLKIFFLLIVLILNFTSIYRTFDPVTLNVFNDKKTFSNRSGLFFTSTKFSFGNHTMIAVGNLLYDAIVYNGQFVFINTLYNKFIKDYKFSDNDVIFISGSRWAAETSFIKISTLNNKVTFNSENYFTPQICCNFSNDSLKVMPEKAYYISYGYLVGWDSVQVNKVKQFYHVSPREVIDSFGYSFNVYKLRKHPNYFY